MPSWSAVARTTVESDPPDRAASLVEATSRIIVLTAPPGYGKSDILSAAAARVGPLVVCELPVSGDGPDLARAVVDALVAGHGSRAARSAADRLAQRRELVSATSRETLRREWPVDGGPELFVFYDPAGVLATPAGADLFAELAGGFPPARRLAVSMRTPLPPALQQIVGRERATIVAAGDLRLSLDDALRLAQTAGIAEDDARAIYAVSHGWPLASRLLIRLCARHSSAELIDAATAVPHDALLSFAAHRTIVAVAEPVREALIVAALLHGVSHLDLVRVLGNECDDAVFARLVDLPFVAFDGARAAVHREIALLLRARFEPTVRALYERTIDVLTGDGAYVEGARIALDAADIERAAAIIDAAPPYTAARVPLAAYERIIERVDRNLITRYPNLWIATIPYRSYSVDRATYIREAETVYYCLSPATAPDQRAAVLMLLASAYVNVGQSPKADTLLDEALRGFAAGPSPARAALLNLAASLRGIEGRFALARSLAEQASQISRDQFGETQTLHYIESHEATYRGQQDRLVVIIDELLRRRAGEELPLYLTYAALNGALFSWANGDDDAFDRYLTVAEDAVTPGLFAGFGPIFDAARGRPVHLDDQYTWPEVAAIAHLYRIANASSDKDAVDAAHAAAHAADQRRDPFIQTLAHVAVYVLDEFARAQEAATLQAIVASIESPELHDAVRRVIDGRSAGMLEPYVSRRVRRNRAHTEARLQVELLAGRVTRDGMAIRLTDKEFELLAFLASTHGVLSRERIGEALWEHLDPEEWRNNFKVTLHRIRTKLAARDVVLVDEGRYRLAPSVDVDLRRAERTVRERVTVPLSDEVRDELRGIVQASSNGATARYDRFAWGHSLLAHVNDIICGAGIALAADALDRGIHDEALRFASDVTAIDPFNERACETVVRILLDRGDVDGARREFRRYASALANELGAAPSPALAELVRQRS